MQQPANSHSHSPSYPSSPVPVVHHMLAFRLFFSFPAHKMTKSSINSVIVRFLLFRFPIGRCANVCTDGPQVYARRLFSASFVFIFFNFNYSIAFLITVTSAPLLLYAMRDRTTWKIAQRNERTICCTINAQLHPVTKSKLTLWPIKVKLNLS